MDFLKGYKTIIFNALTAIAALGQIVGVIDIALPGSGAVILLAVSAANIGLRFLSTTAVFQAE